MLAVLCLVVATALLDASSLPASSSPVHAAHRGELLAVAAVWLLLALAMLVRGELRGHEPTAVLVLAIILIGTYGSVVPDDHWRWQCITTLTVLTALTRMHHSGRGVVALVAGAQVASLLLLLQLDLHGAYLAYNASVVVALVAVPAVVVSVMASALDRARADAERAARTDVLTGLLNRRALVDDVPPLVRRCAEQGSRVAVMLLDLDHFKRVNDTWGHTAGDRLLLATTGAVRAELRSCDLLARWGGEELLVVTRVEDVEQLVATAERVRRSVASLLVADLPPVTVSIGTAAASEGALAQVLAQGDGWRVAARELVGGLVDQADEALYAAKAAGRDRVQHHRGAFPVPEARRPADGVRDVTTTSSGASARRTPRGARVDP